MQERHTNRERYFNEQGVTVEKYVIPFLEDTIEISENTSVLEIGCGEGGNLVPFVKKGCKRIVGIDILPGKIENAKKFFEEMDNGKNVEFITADIYNIDPEELGQFDVIITRDVLEHIHGQERFMEFMKKFLKPGGKFFLGFPPWYNPFGGHQQMCTSKVLSKVPYFHMLPKPIYKSVLKTFGETDKKIEDLLEIKDTGITIERFENILKKTGYKVDKRMFYFINPNYEVKFGLKPKEVWSFVAALSDLRNFFITTNYYVVSA